MMHKLTEWNNWPMAGGPSGHGIVKAAEEPPRSFSVTTGNNIAWATTLPEGGQSGIAIFGDRLFLTIMKPARSENNEDLKGSDIVALCIDVKDGSVLWEREIQGHVHCGYMSGFSDATTPTPVTDGTYVWYTNASGRIVCYDYGGRLIWERTWKPIMHLDGIDFPFNKQFEPFIAGDMFVNMEPYDGEGPSGEKHVGWNYLYGFNKHTGHLRWISEDALTHYNTPVSNGVSVLMGRGGHHQVPELPKGYSMIDTQTGQRMWKYETEEGTALYNASFNTKAALWFTESENVIHVLHPQTGELVKKISLTDACDVRRFDPQLGHYVLEANVNFKKTYDLDIFPAWFTNILIEDKLYFMCFKKGRHRNIGPEYSLCKVDLVSGRVELLEVPVAQRSDGERIWNTELETQTVNSRGLDVSCDKRSRRDGWYWNFNGSPICVNNMIYFTTMLGTVYCIDTTAPQFDEHALVSVNDLGPLGETWSVNTPSFANGKLYHRTLKALICIGS
jgi:outer membrane protein assembly factor BamB